MRDTTCEGCETQNFCRRFDCIKTNVYADAHYRVLRAEVERDNALMDEMEAANSVLNP